MYCRPTSNLGHAHKRWNILLLVFFLLLQFLHPHFPTFFDGQFPILFPSLPVSLSSITNTLCPTFGSFNYHSSSFLLTLICSSLVWFDTSVCVLCVCNFIYFSARVVVLKLFLYFTCFCCSAREKRPRTIFFFLLASRFAFSLSKHKDYELFYFFFNFVCFIYVFDVYLFKLACKSLFRIVKLAHSIWTDTIKAFRKLTVMPWTIF